MILYCGAKWIKDKKYRSIAGQGFVFGGVYSNLQALEI
jgi:hypothetical protein